MREGVPDERVFSRELKVFGDVEVGHHRFLPGETAFPPLPGHLVNLHLGAPTRVVTRREGAGWEGTQPRGNVEVFSAGRATEQAIEGISEDVSVLLGEGFFRRVAEQAGVDPGQVEVMDRFDARDENVEWILLSLMPELGTDAWAGNYTCSRWRPPSPYISCAGTPRSGTAPVGGLPLNRDACSRPARLISPSTTSTPTSPGTCRWPESRPWPASPPASCCVSSKRQRAYHRTST